MSAALITANLRALELLDQLGKRRKLTLEERDILTAWSGWGVMSKVLDPREKDQRWQRLGERVRQWLPPDHVHEAELATPTAFYTPRWVVNAMWSFLEEIGFEGGRVLEPGCGHGAFLAAARDREDSTLTGVERDHTSARIARLLHPDARIITSPLEKAGLPDASFDVVIGNVPFANVDVPDDELPKRVKLSLHNYFLWRALRAVQPGGYVVLITSRYTMDAWEKRPREFLEGLADLMGAVRLPTGWEDDLGSKVVADILVLRRRGEEEEPAGEAWRQSVYASTPGGTGTWENRYELNDYWRRHPEQVLGTMRPDGRAAHGQTLKVDFEGGLSEMESALRHALSRIAKRIEDKGLKLPERVLTIDQEPIALFDERGREEGSFHVEGANVVKIENAKPVIVLKPSAELRALICMRDTYLELLEHERDYDAPDADWQRRQLNDQYDQYVGRFGPLNRCKTVEGKEDETGEPEERRIYPTMGGFRKDPHCMTVMALEVFDEQTGEAGKADILLRRLHRRPELRKVDDPSVAVALCMDRHGRLDVATLATILGVSRLEVEGTLGALVFRDPETDVLVPAPLYLAGRVRDKLDLARFMVAQGHEHFTRNVEALEQVQPEDLTADEVRLRLGHPIVPTADIEGFIKAILRPASAVYVTHEAVAAIWNVELLDAFDRETPAATAEWGTPRANAYDLVRMALSGKMPVVEDVFKDENGDDRKVRNQQETLLAEERLRAIQDRFTEWVWEDHERATRLLAAYNRQFNAVVLPRYDGSHLTFPGINPLFKPYAHQPDMVMRAISTRAVLCGYDVGAGKTSVAMMTAITLKRLGLANKPMMVVPNHLLEQFTRECLQLMPGARILMATTEDVSPAQRRLFAARVASQDWDAIIMQRTSFTSLPVHPRIEEEFLWDEIYEYKKALFAARAQEGKRDPSQKELAKLVRRMEGKLWKLLRDRRDIGVTWEQLGVDYLIVDEWSDFFKNDQVGSRKEGLNIAGSKRAINLRMKMQELSRRRPDKPIAMMMTGTPVTNSLAELYVLLRLLDPELLRELDLLPFDAWAAAFVEYTTGVEVAPDGTRFRLHTRPDRYINVADLRRLLAQVADIRTAESMNLKRPSVLQRTVVVPQNEAQRAFSAELAARADAIHEGGVDPEDDNMLSICMDGRMSATDPALAGIESTEPGKVEAIVENVLGYWREFRETPAAEAPAPNPPMDLFGWAEWQEQQARVQRGTDDGEGVLQVIFLDIGTPRAGGDQQVYGKLRRGLIAGGMKAQRVRFIHDYPKPQDKAKLYAECNSGKVDVLIGSTSKLGLGTNIQRRLKVIHHADPPWRPADVQQRRGRGQRPGNMHAEIIEVRYVTEGSFDSYMWQALERKIKFILQVLSGDLTVREVPDIGLAVLSYSEVKAAATGNPLLLELAEADAEVVRLKTLLNGHVRNQSRLRWQATADEKDADAMEGQALRLRELHVRAEASEVGLLSRFGRLHDRTEIGDAIAAAFELAKTAEVQADKDGKASAGLLNGLGLQAVARRDYKTWNLGLEVAAGNSTERVGIGTSWTNKGQTWRIPEAVYALVEKAPGRISWLEREMRALRARAAAARQQAETPFAHADELKAAWSRKEEIERVIRAEARGQEDAA